MTEAIQRIEGREGKKISAIQDELGDAVGRSGATVEHWHKGNLPSRPEQTEALCKALAARSDLDRTWFRRSLTMAAYPRVTALLNELPPLPGSHRAGAGQSRGRLADDECPFIHGSMGAQVLDLLGMGAADAVQTGGICKP